MASHFAPQDTPRSSSRARRSSASSRARYGASGGYSRSDVAYYSQARRGHGPGPRKHHVGRIVGIVVGVLLAAVLVVGGTIGVMLFRSVMTVKDDATVLMAQAGTLSESLKNGDSEGLTASVNTIVERAASVNAEVHAPLWDVVALLPVVGEDVSSVQTLGSTAYELVSEALVPISRSISGMKLSELLQDGAINVDLVSALADSVSSSVPVIKRSVETISNLPEAHIPQLREILGKVQDPVSEMSGLVDQIEPILAVLPQMLGSEGTRTYLVIAQNNSELRATGGLPGSWGTISIADGKISMGEFQTILHDEGLKVDITDEERAAIATNMDTDPAQVNCTADFTRVGELSRDYWAQKGKGTVDGVIAIDPVFLQRLMSLTGGVTAPDGSAVDGTNAAKVLLSDTYWKYGNDGDAQDEFFSSVAALSFGQVMNNLGEAGMTDLWQVIDQSGKDGRLLVWMANPDEQNLMVELGFSGGLGDDPSAPVLGVYFNDDTYSKISWYASTQTQIGEGVKNADGTTTYDVTTTLANTITPEEAATAPLYIYGGNQDKRDNSDMLNFVFFYAPAGGTISNMTVSAGGLFEDYGIVESTMSGLQVLRMRTHARSGETITFTYQVTVSAEASEPLALRTTPLAQESLMLSQNGNGR